MNNNNFATRCQGLFGERLGYGRRWKTAAAQALGIGRATLYRYFSDHSAVAPDVLRKLDALERPQHQPIRTDYQMLTLFSRALLDAQREIDEHGGARHNSAGVSVKNSPAHASGEVEVIGIDNEPLHFTRRAGRPSFAGAHEVGRRRLSARR